MQSELLYGLPSVAGFGNYSHIGFGIDQRRDPFAQERVIIP